MSVRITPPVLDRVLTQVELETGVSAWTMLSGSMAREAIPARQLAMWRLRQITLDGKAKHSFPEIGRVFGRHHATVMFACRQIEKRLLARAIEVAA